VTGLIPAPLETLLAWALAGLERERSVFGLPRRSFWRDPDGLDLSVAVPGGRAANPLGIAAGPHTQLAHNIVVAWLAGARSIELKTVQALDRIEVPRPCIDAPAEAYNVEWSQELSLDQSLEQYVAAWCLVHALAARDLAGAEAGRAVREGRGLAGTRFDASVGYDLAGIRSERVARFLDGLTDARPVFDALRERLPAPLRASMEVAIPARVVDTVTLSTFHGCPPGEIERIVEHLLDRHGMNVVVKLNPTLLGSEEVARLLHDRLGHSHLGLDLEAFAQDLGWEEALGMLDRLAASARRRHRAFGVKLTNTLVIRNPGRGLAGDRVYLSGPPLHPIAIALADRLARATGGVIPISFSAGVCAENFADTVACGFAPVTVCTDLLQPTGYRRLPRHLKALVAELERTGARTIGAYVAARAREAGGATTGTWAAAASNLAGYAARVAGDPRYQAAPASLPPAARPPLRALDCDACNRCTLVCPNGAFFSFKAPARRTATWELVVAGGSVTRRAVTLETRCEEQWILLADFCNACGNCDTFCPEAGGPHRIKPRVHGSSDAYRAAAPEDGILIERGGASVRARFASVEHRLEREGSGWRFTDGVIEATLDPDLGLIAAHLSAPREGHVLPLARAHALRLWVEGCLAGVNPVSAVIGGAATGGEREPREPAGPGTKRSPGMNPWRSRRPTAAGGVA
jgi:putative selenate reductase